MAAIAPSAARSSGAVTFRVAAPLSPQAARRAAGIPCEPPLSAGQGRPCDPRGRRPWRSSDRHPSAQAAPPSPGSSLSHEGHRQERREVISAHAIPRNHGTRARSRHEDDGGTDGALREGQRSIRDAALPPRYRRALPLASGSEGPQPRASRSAASTERRTCRASAAAIASTAAMTFFSAAIW